MKIINNLSIGKRLVILVCIAIAVIVATALEGMSNSRRVAEEAGLGYEAITRPLAAVSNAHGGFNAMRADLYDLAHDFNTEAQNRMFKEQAMNNLDIFERNIALYKHILDTYGTNDPYEREAVDYMYGELAPLRDHVEYIVSIAEKTGREADAVKALRGDFLKVAKDISYDLMALTRILEAQIHEENLRARQIYKERSQMYALATVGVSLVLLLAAYSIVLSIIRPLKEMTAVAAELSEGRIDVYIGYEANNELGILANSFRSLTKSLRDIIYDMQKMAEGHTDGDIEYFIDHHGYRGSYYDMVVGINKMMRISVEDLKAVIDYLQNLAGGENVKVIEFPGKKAVLSDSLNALVGKVHYDMLTGIYNRRYMEENLNRIIKSMSRSGGGLFSVMMIDIDFFKRFNDTYGHASGDECLRIVAKAINDCITRESDFAARYGGEEFTVVLPNTDEKGACIIAQRMLERVRACKIPHEKSDAAGYVTVSIGVATGETGCCQEGMDYIKQADQALYVSKESGRDRFTFCSLSM